MRVNTRLTEQEDLLLSWQCIAIYFLDFFFILLLIVSEP